MTDRRPAREQKLPPAEAAEINSLPLKARNDHVRSLYEAGWTLQAIGEACEPPVHRSTVRKWVTASKKSVTPSTEKSPLPTPKYRTPAEYEPKKPINPGINADTAEKIRDLSYLASKYRATIPDSHPAAIASREYDQLVRKLHSDGVPLKEIADIAGVSYKSIYRRVHGAD